MARRLSDGREQYDVCIVGAGPAGISLAVELDGSPLRICVLEAGGDSYGRETQRLLEGEHCGEHYPPLRDTRLAALGGSSNVWAGWCRPLDPMDFRCRPGAQGIAWPFGSTELAPYYRRAQEFCGLAGFEYEADYWRERLQQAVLLEDDEYVKHAMFQVLPQRFGIRYREQLEASRNVEVVLRSPVTRLQRASDGSIRNAQVRTLKGLQLRVRAHRYVLAAGGIENARLLLSSPDSAGRAPGNLHGLVGRYFTDHPFVNLGSLVLDGGPRRLDFYFPQRVPPNQTRQDNRGRDPSVRACLTLAPAALEAEGLQNCALFFHPRYEAHPMFATPEVRAFLHLWDKLRRKSVPGGLAPYISEAARSPHLMAAAAVRKLLLRNAYAKHWRARAMFETQSRYENRVVLSSSKDSLNRSRARVEWRLSEFDLHCMQRAARLFDASLRRARVGRLEPAFPDTAEGWHDAVEGGKHHMGTTRIHENPRYGVVDADGRVHDTHNLYLAGSSVFPSGGYANPTLTIVALALRMADHLRSAGTGHD